MRRPVILAVTSVLVLAAPAFAAGPPDPLRSGIERGLRRLEAGSGNYVKNRQCFSCHHQALTIAAMVSARQKGFAIDEARLKEQMEFTHKTFSPKLETIAKGQGVGGASTTVAYALFTLEVGGQAPDETTQALLDFLLAKQRPDGSWAPTTQRQPSEGSSFTTAALTLAAIQHYKPRGDSGADVKKRDELEKAFARGREWLLTNTKPAHTEDAVFRLRGLVASDAPADAVKEAKGHLVKLQREDGGWGQLPERDSDAYATGSALIALRAAGVSPRDPAYQKGVRYLLRTQREDGAWVVETRSRPVQIFFDNGDPGGKSQFISFAATGWAVCALLEATAR